MNGNQESYSFRDIQAINPEVIEQNKFIFPLRGNQMHFEFKLQTVLVNNESLKII